MFSPRRHGVRALAGLTVAAALATSALAAAPAQAVTRSHLWDWGGGPLGLGKYADRTKPVPVHGLGTAAVRQVVSSNGTVLVLLKDGTVWAWGSGPLGNGGGPSVSSQSPLQVTALSGVTAIAATTLLTASFDTLSTFYALRGNGTVWAWGDGSAGQLGDGSTASRYTPGPVTGLSRGHQDHHRRGHGVRADQPGARLGLGSGNLRAARQRLHGRQRRAGPGDPGRPGHPDRVRVWLGLRHHRGPARLRLGCQHLRPARRRQPRHGRHPRPGPPGEPRQHGGPRMRRRVRDHRGHAQRDGLGGGSTGGDG